MLIRLQSLTLKADPLLYGAASFANSSISNFVEAGQNQTLTIQRSGSIRMFYKTVSTLLFNAVQAAKAGSEYEVVDSCVDLDFNITSATSL